MAVDLLLVSAGALIPGFIATRQAKQSAADRALAQQTLDRLREREVSAEVERGTTAIVVAAIAPALLRVIADPRQVEDFGRAVLRELYRVLSNRAPLRVLFLRYHGGASHGLPEPIDKGDGGKPVIFASFWSIGEQDHMVWEIRGDEASAKVAKRIMERELPWNGALLIDDITKPEFIEGRYDVLRPPGNEVASYCRAAVTHGERQFGILCADCWNQVRSVRPTSRWSCPSRSCWPRDSA